MLPMGARCLLTRLEVDSRWTAGLCQPWNAIFTTVRDLLLPAQVPDHLITIRMASKCAAATKDWRNLDLVPVEAASG